MSRELEIRSDIQVLRGVAIVLVVLYHLDIKGFELGFLGVDIFFVISGFLIAKIAPHQNISDFLMRRIRRLAPSYFFTLFVVTTIVFFYTIPADSNQFLERLPFHFFGLSNFSFWAENSYFTLSSFRPLLNLWSLAVELQFYLMFVCGLIFLVRINRLMHGC